MFISNAQLKKIDEHYILVEDHRYAKNLREIFPDQTKNISDSDLLNNIKLRRDECREFEIHSDAGIFYYLCVEFIFGADFYYVEEFVAFLLCSDYNGDEAIESFFDEMEKV